MTDKLQSTKGVQNVNYPQGIHNGELSVMVSRVSEVVGQLRWYCTHPTSREIRSSSIIRGTWGDFHQTYHFFMKKNWVYLREKGRKQERAKPKSHTLARGTKSHIVWRLVSNLPELKFTILYLAFLDHCVLLWDKFTLLILPTSTIVDALKQLNWMHFHGQMQRKTFISNSVIHEISVGSKTS